MSLVHVIKTPLTILLLVGALTAYSEVEQVALQTGKLVEKSVEKNTSSGVFDQKQFYQALVAEFYNQSGEAILALDYYLPLALLSNDVVLVKRVTEIATGSGQLLKGLNIAKHWVELNPESIEARQYFTLLLLRDDQLKHSAQQLQFVRQIIEKNSKPLDNKSSKQPSKQLNTSVLSKGLKFIGALLIIESQHDKAYRVFKHYIKMHGSELYLDQQNLILASLAMKAKKYEGVILALKDLGRGDAHFSSAAVMKTKALQKLGRVNEATLLLEQIVRLGKSSDSLRLELARLLILAERKHEAKKLLNNLINSHPDNNDLLKSMIALNIDQQDWQEAERNNKKLRKSKGYQSDVNYFYGEIYEAAGNFKQALLSYQEVKRGSFLKHSHRKVSHLIARLESLKSAQQWLQTEQKKSAKKKNKAYWLKLEADLLADKTMHSEKKIDQQNINDALGLYNRIIKLIPNKVSYRYHRGLLYERLNQIEFAENDFKRVLKKRKNDVDTLNALGFLLVKHTTRFEEAKKHIQHAFTLKPNDPTILDSLGWVYFRTGEVDRAEDLLRKAFDKAKSPEIASHLISVLLKSGQQREANKLYNEMIEKYPDNSSLSGVRTDLRQL